MATGQPFHELLERDVFAAAEMDDACTSVERAILRSTAVGHVPDAATGEVRRTGIARLCRCTGPPGH